jgi:hypothetical protein
MHSTQYNSVRVLLRYFLASSLYLCLPEVNMYDDKMKKLSMLTFRIKSEK